MNERNAIHEIADAFSNKSRVECEQIISTFEIEHSGCSRDLKYVLLSIAQKVKDNQLNLQYTVDVIGALFDHGLIKKIRGDGLEYLSAEEIRVLRTEVEELKSAIQALGETWTPVVDGGPRPVDGYSQMILISIYSRLTGENHIIYGQYLCGKSCIDKWIDANGRELDFPVLAYMYLPLPYKAEDKLNE